MQKLGTFLAKTIFSGVTVNVQSDLERKKLPVIDFWVSFLFSTSSF